MWIKEELVVNNSDLKIYFIFSSPFAIIWGYTSWSNASVSNQAFFGHDKLTLNSDL